MSIGFESTDSGGSSGDGWFQDMKVPVPRGFLINGIRGSGLGAANESGISGTTASRVHQVRVTFDNGETDTFEPLRARHKVQRKKPWTRALRFFDYFHAGNLEPVKLTLLGSGGRVIAHVRATRFGFDR